MTTKKKTTKGSGAKRTAFHTYPETRADMQMILDHYRKHEDPEIDMAKILRRYIKQDAERIRLLAA